MPYDLYDYFLKQRNNNLYTESTEIVRQKLWRETYDVVEAQEWFKKERKRFNRYL